MHRPECQGSGPTECGFEEQRSRLFLRRTADGITERASLNDDSRCVQHVTFGSVLADGALADRFGELREQYAANLEGPLRQPPAPVRLMEPPQPLVRSTTMWRW